MLYSTLIISTLLATLTAGYECPIKHKLITTGGCVYRHRCVRDKQEDADAFCNQQGSKRSTGQHIANVVGPSGHLNGDRITYICCAPIPNWDGNVYPYDPSTGY
ncbi:hypothetical protein EG328_011019 [Venturia inaequalis]|uniref:Uncharacterized protein n=1 Tax=Venturia inaequalis TaxID=5025 RepID=A0A8H3VPZ0_VENIN|nr:hypothetical protein EG328_011019 [Venturia inaequalis]KAE9993224.1 hypothetical protein EG327_006025 [Venturia inaequalis]RDI86461.1 hypothetical protein Vi05172_g3571 [Venturia inaequalis]